MNASFLQQLLDYRAEHEYDPVSSSSVQVRELFDPRIDWKHLAIVRGPKIFQVERWLNDNYDEELFHVTSGASGTHVYFNDETMAMNLKLTWTIG